MKENTIISLADANYFELLNELVDSINRFAQSEKLDICIMDAGLTDDQIKILDLKVKEKEAALVDCPYFEEQLKKMRGQMITLMESRRYYRNKGLAYEYYIDKTNLV